MIDPLTPEQRRAAVKLLCDAKRFLFDAPADETEAERLINSVIELTLLAEASGARRDPK